MFKILIAATKISNITVYEIQLGNDRQIDRRIDSGALVGSILPYGYGNLKINNKIMSTTENNIIRQV